ncbi:MAG: dTDP-4-dehydrorhamnose reductase [Phycisphaerales bacterium]|nr:dTDP-4-dehydrorhamnose reductase [Phycisphaerales bacterium]MCB9862340.1 dTDP-4-dehydrorhamnose reductase [Phycisphaerales bacterium]
MKILVTGANGLLGSALARQIAARDDLTLIKTDRGQLDITMADAVLETVRRERPNWIVNCAAFTQVDKCETDEALATHVNGQGAGHVAAAAADVDAGLIHVSTDYIFPGDATTPIPTNAAPGDPGRLSAYGRSKLLGEQRVRQAHTNPTIVRTAWVYGHDGPCFPAAILALAREGKLKKVVDDQRGSPTYAEDLADGILRLIDADATGDVHVVNDGACTWCEFAVEILRLAAIDLSIQPCTTAEFPRPAKRPAYSVLDLARYESLTSHRPRHWKDAIADFMADAS